MSIIKNPSVIICIGGCQNFLSEGKWGKEYDFIAQDKFTAEGFEVTIINEGICHLTLTYIMKIRAFSFITTLKRGKHPKLTKRL